MPLAARSAELKALFTEFQGNQVRHAGGVLATVRFGHYVFGDKAVFAYDVGHAGESTAVTQRVVEQPLYHFVVHRFVAGVDNALQEKIRFLQLVEEERIGLRKLERAEIVAGDGLGTHHVQTGEEPAAAGRFLVGDAFGVHFDGEVRIHTFQVFLVESQFADVVVADGVADSLVSRGVLITLFNLLHHVVADAAFCVLSLCRITESTENKN